MTGKKFIHVLLSICVFISMLVCPIFAGCSKESGETLTLALGIVGFPRTKNPFASLGPSDYNALTQVYEPLLVHTDNYNEALPMLAKSWEYDSSTLTWTFHLDEKAKFSDGTPVTANDVKYTWETAFNVANIFTDCKKMVQSIAVVDDRTIKFKLNASYAYFLQQIGNGLIVPQHVWATVGDPVTYANDNPIGSGPYFWTEYVTDSHCTFTKNPNYWRGASKIDEVILKLYGTAENMLMAFRKGDIDAMNSMDTKSAIPTLLMDPNINVQLNAANQTMLMMINLRREPFNILAFREAINIVINRRSLIDTVLLGYAIIPQQAPIPPSIADCNTTVKWPYDYKTQTELTAMANAKLDAIPGMSAKGADGIRSYNGNKLIFDYVHSTTAETVRTVEITIANCKEIGIQFNSKSSSFTAAYAKVFRHEGKAPLGWDAFYTPSSAANFYSDWGTPAPAPLEQGGVWLNPLKQSEAAGWTNKVIQDKMAQQAIEVDPDKRAALHLEIQELFAKDVPCICLQHGVIATTYRTDRFTGWIAHTGPYSGVNILYGSNAMQYQMTTLNSLNLKPITP